MGMNRCVVTVIAGVAVWGASLVSLQARQSHIHTMVQNPDLVNDLCVGNIFGAIIVDDVKYDRNDKNGTGGAIHLRK